jgi:hypothetical protein
LEVCTRAGEQSLLATHAWSKTDHGLKPASVLDNNSGVHRESDGHPYDEHNPTRSCHVLGDQQLESPPCFTPHRRTTKKTHRHPIPTDHHKSKTRFQSRIPTSHPAVPNITTTQPATARLTTPLAHLPNKIATPPSHRPCRPSLLARDGGPATSANQPRPNSVVMCPFLP